MDDLIEWEFLEPGVKFRWNGRVYLVCGFKRWDVVCRIVHPWEYPGTVEIGRNRYEMWQEIARQRRRMREDHLAANPG